VSTPFEKDKQAFGEDSSGLLDLRFGNPYFLEPYWRAHNNDITILSGTKMSYKKAMVNGPLKKAIVDIHNKIGNAETKDYHVIVGHGASQVISAALYALSLRGPKDVFATHPHFPRFEHFTMFAGNGLTFHKRPPLEVVADKWIQIITHPNNPDASIYPISRVMKYKVLDLCYMWPQYTEVTKYAEDIMVFSLAKATGHASTRIGWALVKDKAIADDMAHYIEMSTSGVSYEAKYYAERILVSQMIDFNGTCFKHGADKLKRRWETFHEATQNNKDFKVINCSGMFIWGAMLDEKTDATEYLKEKGILGVNGTYFGVLRKNCFRLNIGCEVEKFERLVAICHGKTSLTSVGSTTVTSAADGKSGASPKIGTDTSAG
jgi:L-tryptophan--pyruvate aminotransferase